MKPSLVLATIHVFLAVSESARILVLGPTGSKSHLNGFMPMVEALASKGHYVTVVTAHSPKTDSPNVRKIALDDLVEYVEHEWYTFGDKNYASEMNVFEKMQLLLAKAYTSFMANEEIQQIITDKAVDLVIVDAIMNEIVLPAIDHLGVPFIYYSPGSGGSWTLAAMNADQELASVPDIGFEMGSKMSFFERMQNLVVNQLFLLMRKPILLRVVDEMAKNDFPNARPAEEIERDAALCLANIDRATSWPRNLPPTIIPVGAMHCRPAQPLPKDLETFADGAKEGLVIFTLGSNAQVSLMPEHMKQMFVRVFARLPQRVIWKWEKESLLINSVSPNVKLVDWLPQQDLLGHKNTRLFISHGGLLGTQEAIYHGIPILGLPLGRDQRSVLRKCVEEGAAIKFEWNELTEELLYDNIRRLIEEPNFKGNASRLSRLIRDEVMPAKDVAVYWVEYVLRHNGTRHLQSAAKDMPFYQYYLLDVWLFILLILFVILLVGVKALGYILRTFCSSRKAKTQ